MIAGSKPTAESAGTGFRSFLARLQAHGELHRIDAEVDWDLEACHISKLADLERGPALLFERVKDYGTPLFLSALNTPRRMGLALGMPEAKRFLDIIRSWQERLRREVDPVPAAEAPCKEVILGEGEVDLAAFPWPRYYDKDGGRYITTGCVLSRDPATGWLNVGTYRLMLHDRNTLGILMNPSKHGRLQYEAYEAQGRPMPVVIANGVDPAVFMVACTPVPAAENELAYAGGLVGSPIGVVKAETCDLEVPADSEIVIEGEILPGERRLEGPFGEYTGHYTPANPKPVVRVRCVTHRRDPIVWGTTHGKPITDGHAICTVNRSAGIWYELNRLGLPGLQGVYCPEAAGAYFVTVVSIRQRYPGHGRHAGHAVYATPSGNYANKLVIVVDDDIDPSNMDEVWWAVATRFQPSRDSVVWEGGTGTPLDPSIPAGEKPLTSRMILDATRPYPLERGEEVVSLTPEVVERVKAKWGEYFPPDAR